MQWFTLVSGVMAICAMSMARTIPNGMVFYQTSPVYYKRSVPLTHRMMYVQYMPQHASRRSATSGGVSAFAAGDTIATGTYLRDCNHNTEEGYAPPEKASVEYQQDFPPNPIADQGATSIAEAYPEQNLIAPDRVEVEEPDFENDPLKISISQSNQQSEPAPETPQPPQESPSFPEVTEAAPELVEIKKEKKPKELIPEDEYIPEQEPTHAFEPTEAAPASNDVEVPAEIPAETPASHPIVASPAKAYIPPKKKVRVELEAPESSEYDYEQPYYVPHYHNKNKAVASTKRPQSLPPGTFFPIDFGGATGGAIAIANSFSTGEGGSATSTATAYGSPASARAKAAKKRLAQQ